MRRAHSTPRSTTCAPTSRCSAATPTAPCSGPRGPRRRPTKQSAERANALRLSGRAQRRLGQGDAAATALAQALAIDRKLGLSDRVALDLVYAAENEAARGNAAAAREFYERALDVYQAAGNSQAADGVRLRLATLTR